MSKKQNNRNPVAKHAEKFNKSQTFTDRKKELKKSGDDDIDFDLESDFFEDESECDCDCGAYIDIERMEEALKGPFTEIPSGLSMEELENFILNDGDDDYS